ncbi:MAG: TRAP transporter large permease [Betaproteobacteria bacterium]
MTVLLVAGLILLLALNVPVGYAMLAVSVAYVSLKPDLPLIVAAQQVAAGSDKFLLLAIPFFFLAAEFMSSGGVMHRLVNLARALVGHMRGGLGQMNIVGSVFFAGISGSAVADAAGLGRVEIEIMRRGGYPTDFSAVVTAASATIGPIIPPSIPLVVYGSIAGVSVGKLFLGGFVPGLLMALALMCAVHFLSIRNHYPRDAWVGWPALARSVVRSIPVLMLPAIILGGIFSGVFTATESAIVASVYAMGLGLILRELEIKAIPGILAKVACDTARVMFIVAAASFYSWILAREGLPGALAGWFIGLGTEAWTFLLLVNLLLLVLGTFMEPIPIMVIVVPALLPVVTALGIDLVHFGLVVTLNLMIGLVTPPVGLVMYVVMQITGLKLETFLRALWPFLLALLVALFVITYIPSLVLFLPRMFYS